MSAVSASDSSPRPAPPAWRAPLAGLAAAIPIGILLFYLPEITFDLLCVLLALLGGLLLGRGRPRVASLETGAAVVFVFLGVQGLWWSASWLTLGYLVHAAADAFFGRRREAAQGGRWRPGATVVFDVIVAALVWLL